MSRSVIYNYYFAVKESLADHWSYCI